MFSQQANVPQWRDNRDEQHPQLIQEWLYDTGSLTEKLLAHCGDFSVEVLRQGVFPLLADETSFQHFGEIEVREVLLWCDGRPWVFARSLMPKKMMQSADPQLADIGTKPLGKIIFNDPSYVRDRFEVATFDQQATIWQPYPQLTSIVKHPLWGRRSVFHRPPFQLSVMEIFLPDSPIYGDGSF